MISVIFDDYYKNVLKGDLKNFDYLCTAAVK